MSGLMTTAGGESAPASVWRMVAETAPTGGHRPTSEGGTPRMPAPFSALRALEAEYPVSASSRSGGGDSHLPDSRLRIEPPPFADCAAASAPLSFDPTPAASISFGGEGMRPHGDEDVHPAGFARAEECLVRTDEVAPFRPRSDHETGCALSKDGADGFTARLAHAATAGSVGNPAQVVVSGRGRSVPSHAGPSERPVEGCARWMRGDSSPTSPPKPRETPLRGSCAKGGAHPESPTNPGGAPAPSLIRPEPDDAATSSESPLPPARSVANSRWTPASRTKPESSAATVRLAESKAAIGDDECPALETEVALPETGARNFASAPPVPRMRNCTLHDATVAEESVDAAQAVDAVPPRFVKRPGMVDRNGPRFAKENPGFARLVRKSEDASKNSELESFLFFGNLATSRMPLHGNRKIRKNGRSLEGRFGLRFASSASAPVICGIEQRKELAS